MIGREDHFTGKNKFMIFSKSVEPTITMIQQFLSVHLQKNRKLELEWIFMYQCPQAYNSKYQKVEPHKSPSTDEWFLKCGLYIFILLGL